MDNRRGFDMNNQYDVIVIGAGNAGLVAALELVKSEKKVLVLESDVTPGGFATSFTRGRFEFETSLHAIYDYGNKEHPGSVYKLFQKLGIVDKVDFVTIPGVYHVYSMDTKVDYQMPSGIIDFIEKMEEYVPGSKTAMKKFFLLAQDVAEALNYIEQNKENIDMKVLNTKYENFVKIGNASVEKVFSVIHLPKKAQEILSTYWFYFGSSISTLSFVHFASIVYSCVNTGVQIPFNRSFEISLLLAQEIEKLGGEIKYLSTVKEILFKEHKIAGVQLVNGDIYCAKHIIANLSPTNVYGQMIPSQMIPKDALKLTNSRVLGARGFTIYLGLNQSAKDLGLNEYRYFIYNSLNSNKEFQNMSSIKNNSSVVTVLNNAVSSCSPKGTCIMQFTSLFFGDAFSKAVTEENYFALKDKIADEILDAFEKSTGITIKPYIEEIEIATPVTFARYGGHPDGVIYGYKATGMDNLLPRMFSMASENYIDHLRFCGGFDAKLSGYGSTYLSGDMAAKFTLIDMKGEVE